MSTPSVVVPDLTGLDVPTASGVLTAAALTLATPYSFAYSATVIGGDVISQLPVAGTSVVSGSSVAITVSQGVRPNLVPNILGLTQAQGVAAFAAAGIPQGGISSVNNSALAGSIIYQNPPAGSSVSAVILGSFVVSLGPIDTEDFDFEATVIAQYANSPTLLQLIDNMYTYFNQRVNIQAFFDYVWNVLTAQGFGLDILGRIVDISRLLEIQYNFSLLGFENNTTPPGVEPFGSGVFNVPGGGITSSYELPDDAYRTLILVKALANISATTAPAINQLLQNLFPGRGAAYVLDLGNMHMQYTFEFELTPTEFAILSQSGAVPHPAGVFVTIVSIPAGGQIFGFVEAGAASQTFGNGTFYQPGGM